MSIERAATLLATQHGVAHRAQLLGAGLTAAQIETRRLSGSWVERQPLVYAAAGVPETEALRAAAAWLAVRYRARGGGQRLVAVGGRYAARLLAMDVPPEPTVELVVPLGTWFPALEGARVRRVADWSDRTFARVGPLLVTGRADTLVDVAHGLSDAAALTLFQGECFGRPRLRAAVLGRCHRGSKGSARSRRVARDLARGLDSVVHRAGFRALDRAGIAPDACDVEVVAGAGPSDCVYYASRLVLEFDGDAHRLARETFLHDRRKDLLLRRAGFTTLRFTAEQAYAPRLLVRAVRDELAQAAPTLQVGAHG